MAGKESASRARLGVGFERHDYGHSAIAARLVASKPHGGTARQWFRSPDVLALLPFDAPEPQRSYALVWSLPRERCAQRCNDVFGTSRWRRTLRIGSPRPERRAMQRAMRRG